MRKSDVQSFARRPWEELRSGKEAWWVAERERMSLGEAFAMADTLRASAVTLAGPGFIQAREDDLRDLVELKQKLLRADAAGRP